MKKTVRVETKEKQETKIKNLTTAGVMAALITIFTAYVCHIPIGVNGGYVHFGDALIYLTAALLPTPYALAAAAIGGGLADLLTAPMWVPATIIIKMLMVLLFTNKTKRILTLRNVLATVPAYVITAVGYCLAEYVIFDSWSTLLVSFSQNLIQSLGSAVFFIFLGLALDKAQVKTRYMI